jgi:hypothetical protein
MQPEIGFVPIQKNSVAIPSSFSVFATSFSAVKVQPFSWGLPLTRITFMISSFLMVLLEAIETGWNC